MPTIQTPYNKSTAVTPSDSVNIAMPSGKVVTDGIYVGGAGHLACVGQDGAVMVLSAVTVATVLPIGAVRVNATGTTATLIQALWQI